MSKPMETSTKIITSLQDQIETIKSKIQQSREELKYENDLMKALITAHKCSFSEYTNKHCIVTKNPSSNTGVNEGTVDITDDRNNPAPNQYYVENPSTDTNTKKYRKSKSTSKSKEKRFRQKYMQYN